MSLLFNKDEILIVNRRLAAIVGLNEAIVLQQVHYWVNRKTGGVEHAGKRWVFNTLEKWQEQFPFWSVDTIKRAFAKLRTEGLLLTEKLSEVGRDRTNYYTIDYAQLALLEANYLQSHQCNLPSCKSADCTDASGQVALIHQGKLHPSIRANCTDANKNKDYTKTTTKSLPVPAGQSAAEKSAPETELQGACRATWLAYAKAYADRYGAAPIRNAKVNAAIKAFVQRIGYDESPAVANFYVERVSDSLVVRQMHSTGLLLTGAEGYRTQWAAGRAMTGTRAKQIDQTSANGNAASEAMAILKKRRAAQGDSDE